MSRTARCFRPLGLSNLPLALTVAFLLPASCLAQTAAGGSTLYQRLGGYDFVARFVDTAFPRVAADPGLARLFRGHSTDSQMRQRQLIVDVLCRETGGPCLYTGRDMRRVHEGLGITSEDWTAFVDVISRTLGELGVGEVERADLLRLFEERMRPTVVVP